MAYFTRTFQVFDYLTIIIYFYVTIIKLLPLFDRNKSIERNLNHVILLQDSGNFNVHSYQSCF